MGLNEVDAALDRLGKTLFSVEPSRQPFMWSVVRKEFPEMHLTLRWRSRK